MVGSLHDRVGAPVNGVVDEMAYAAAGQTYLEWVTYRGAAELHTQLVEPDMTTDVRMLDAMTLCATRIATRMSMSQVAAEGLLHRAIVLRDRLPHVFECLRNGQVSPRHKTPADARSVNATVCDARTSSTTNPNHRSERGETSGCRP